MKLREEAMRLLLRSRSLAGSFFCRRRWSSSSSKKKGIWSFGDNSSGAVGPGVVDAYEASRIPNNILLPSNISSVAAGHYHSLALTTDGHIWAWGRNNEAQLGRGPSPNSPRDTWHIPEKVVGLDHVNVISAYASGVVSAAISDDGSLWVWGKSKRGQLGLGEGNIEAIKPSRVESLAGHEIVKVSFGWGHALALTKDGKLFGWGYSKDRRLGKVGQELDAPSVKSQNAFEALEKSSMLEIAEKLVAQKIDEGKNMPIIWEPCLIEELSNVAVSDVACGLDHTLILCCNGTLLSCGDNTYGQLGRRTGGSEMLPVDIGFQVQPVSLSAGLGHCLAICKIPSTGVGVGEGTGLVSWGWNRSFQLGRQGPEEIPAIVEGLEGEMLVSASAGRVHSIALNSKGQVWTWGSGRNGRLGLGSSADEMEPTLLESLDGLEVIQAVSGFDHNLLLIAE